MRHFMICLALTSVLLLPACKTTQDTATTTAAPQLTGEQLAALRSSWIGMWAGAWKENGTCASSIEVKQVTGTSAVATYTWGGGCGGVPGSYTDDSASLSGDVLQLRLKFGWGAKYRLLEDGNLAGEWWSRGRKHTASATFIRQ